MCLASHFVCQILDCRQLVCRVIITLHVQNTQTSLPLAAISTMWTVLHFGPTVVDKTRRSRWSLLQLLCCQFGVYLPLRIVQELSLLSKSKALGLFEVAEQCPATSEEGTAITHRTARGHLSKKHNYGSLEVFEQMTSAVRRGRGVTSRGFIVTSTLQATYPSQLAHQWLNQPPDSRRSSVYLLLSLPHRKRSK